MKNETLRTVLLLVLCLAGGALIGFNAGHLSNGLNAGLFVLGIALVSCSVMYLGASANRKKKQ